MVSGWHQPAVTSPYDSGVQSWHLTTSQCHPGSDSPNLRSAFIAELRAWLQFVLAVRALRGRLRSAAFVTELRACFQVRSALHALHSCCGCRSNCEVREVRDRKSTRLNSSH